MKNLTLAAVTMLLITPSAPAATPAFLKFELTENSNSGDPTEVKVSLPLSMLEAMKPTFEDAMANVDMEQHGVDLREIWQQVQTTGPNEWVNINDGDQTVRVATTETHIVVDVTGDENIHLSIPLAVGDALLGGETADFDVMIATLTEMRGQDLMTISGDVTARAWIE